MTREKDPAEIVETIAQSIRVSQRGARKVKAHRFKELFGYQVLNAPRREKIEQLMAEAGIEVRPALKDAGRDDWLVMSMPVEVPVPETSPDPAPKPEWFAHMVSVRTDTEREVEMHLPLTGDGQDLRQAQLSQLKALFSYLFHIKTSKKPNPGESPGLSGCSRKFVEGSESGSWPRPAR
jgi:hypothetical protein